MIHVCYELNDASGKYSKFVGTSMLSMFENTSAEITVHLLHDDTLTDENRAKLIKTAENYSQHMKFYNAEKLFPDKINQYKSYLTPEKIARFSVAGTFRFLKHKILPENLEKIIHIDADTIIFSDIAELYNVELCNKALAAVPIFLNADTTHFKLCRDGKVKTDAYFNAGIMLMNLDYFRQMDNGKWEEIIKSVSQNPEYEGLLSQNIFNVAFAKNYLKLPKKFNVFVRDQRKKNILDVKPGNIYHYLDKAFGADMRDNYNRLFFKYFSKTLWCDENTIEKIFDFFRNNYNGEKTLMVKISSIIAGKERIFFTEYCNIEPVKRTFLVKENEEIISTDPDEILWDNLLDCEKSGIFKGSLKKLLESMKIFKGEKIFFLLVSGAYSKMCEILQSEGLIENRDFINGDLFRCELSGEPFNVYPKVIDL